LSELIMIGWVSFEDTPNIKVIAWSWRK
jgi:hypothetical protein